jgi:hypothetical protein
MKLSFFEIYVAKFVHFSKFVGHHTYTGARPYNDWQTKHFNQNSVMIRSAVGPRHVRQSERSSIDSRLMA